MSEFIITATPEETACFDLPKLGETFVRSVT